MSVTLIFCLFLRQVSGLFIPQGTILVAGDTQVIQMSLDFHQYRKACDRVVYEFEGSYGSYDSLRQSCGSLLDTLDTVTGDLPVLPRVRRDSISNMIATEAVGSLKTEISSMASGVFDFSDHSNDVAEGIRHEQRSLRMIGTELNRLTGEEEKIHHLFMAQNHLMVLKDICHRKRKALMALMQVRILLI